MARLAGVDLPREKRMEIALTYIYGIGRTRSKELLTATELSADLRVEGPHRRGPHQAAGLHREQLQGRG